MQQRHFLRLKVDPDLKISVCVRRHSLHLDPGHTDRLQIFYIFPVQLCLISQTPPFVQNTAAVFIERSLFNCILPSLCHAPEHEFHFQLPLIFVTDMPDPVKIDLVITLGSVRFEPAEVIAQKIQIAVPLFGQKIM